MKIFCNIMSNLVPQLL